MQSATWAAAKCPVTHAGLASTRRVGKAAYAWLPTVNPRVESDEVDVRGSMIGNSILPSGWNPAHPPG